MNILFQQSRQRVFGTYPLKGDDLNKAVAAAIKTGYRAFDTAQMYGNEADTGIAVINAIKAAGIPREDICIITKVHPDNYDPAKFMASVEQSLKDIGGTALDVLLLHWPPAGEAANVAAPVKLLAEAHKRGLARNIGVSNFNLAMLEVAKNTAGDIPIIANQVEFHPLLDQSRLLNGASAIGIPLMSYCSVARGAVFKHALFTEIAKTYDKLPGQVALRWIVQKGVIVNTMSTKPDNINANFDIMDFTLSHVDMARIDALAAAENYRIVDKGKMSLAPDWD